MLGVTAYLVGCVWFLYLFALPAVGWFIWIFWCLLFGFGLIVFICLWLLICFVVMVCVSELFLLCFGVLCDCFVCLIIATLFAGGLIFVEGVWLRCLGEHGFSDYCLVWLFACVLSDFGLLWLFCYMVYCWVGLLWWLVCYDCFRLRMCWCDFVKCLAFWVWCLRTVRAFDYVGLFLFIWLFFSLLSWLFLFVIVIWFDLIIYLRCSFNSRFLGFFVDVVYY